jgi:hypothetical protein
MYPAHLHPAKEPTALVISGVRRRRRGRGVVVATDSVSVDADCDNGTGVSHTLRPRGWDGAAGYRVLGVGGAMPIRTSRVVGHEENVTVIADALPLTGNGLAECNRVPVGKLPFRVPLGRGAGRFWLAHAPGVCLATCPDCSSSRYPYGSTPIRKCGRSPPAAAAR